MAKRYRFVMTLDRELTQEELHDLEFALYAQCEDYGCENSKLFAVAEDPKINKGRRAEDKVEG